MNLVLLYCLLSIFLSTPGETNPDSYQNTAGGKTEWILSHISETISENIKITGAPEIIESKYGKALLFNGMHDAIFLESMPLDGLEQFTIEVIFQPASGGNFEQRFLHCGEVQGNRVLLELRSTNTHWYLDAYIKSEDQQKALIDSGLLHPLNQWHHLAFVVDHGKLKTYVNGKKELDSYIGFDALHEGKTSIGVRQNGQSWFKGAIYKITISPKALKSKKFMSF